MQRNNRPLCSSCRVKPVGFNHQTKTFLPSCADCRCTFQGCFDKAINEKGLCQTHFRQPVQHEEQEEQKQQQTCKLCMKECRGKYCSTCYPKVPSCANCNTKKAIMSRDTGKFFRFCQYCKCSSKPCGQMKNLGSMHCTECEQNSVCQGCGGNKSTNHQNALCRRCQIPKCKKEECQNKTGFYTGEDGQEYTFDFCRSCTCESKDCYNGKVNAWFCATCVQKHKNFCKADNCNKPIDINQEYCHPCNKAYERGLVKCLGKNCQNYRFPKFDFCATCHKEE